MDKPQTFWWIFRGVENLPVYLGNIQLPPNARLRLQVHNDTTLDLLQMIDLAQSPGAGALYQVTLAVASGNCNFLETMLRAYIDGAEEWESLWLAAAKPGHELRVALRMVK